MESMALSRLLILPMLNLFIAKTMMSMFLKMGFISTWLPNATVTSLPNLQIYGVAAFSYITSYQEVGLILTKKYKLFTKLM